jgi:predicted nucleotide-binding protein
VPSNIFVRRDRRYFAQALSNGTTHGGIDLFEAGLGLGTVGNKDQRASRIVTFMFEEVTDTDQAVIDLLNYLYVDGVQSDWAMKNEHFQALKREVLDPRHVELTDDGYVVPGQETRAAVRLTEMAPSDVQTIDTPEETTVGTPQSDRVFVVYGRDARPVTVLRQFLHFAGLRMMDWSDAVAATGVPQPHTYDIVKAGMAAAAAVVVVFSPDEEARIHPDFARGGSDPDLAVQRQPRQNVLLEAGMAFASAPEKTIFVKSDHTRDISDIEGFNWVKLDGTWDSRNDLVVRLRSAHAAVNLAHNNLMDDLAGPFKVL